MKKHLVQLVVVFLVTMTSTWGATVLQFAGPGFVSGGNNYSITGPLVIEMSGSVTNNISMAWNSASGGSIYLRTTTINTPWIVGHTYRSTDGIGGFLQLKLNSPYRDSASNTSYWEFTVNEAIIDIIPDKFSASGKIIDMDGKATSFLVQYNSVAVPEPSTTLLGLLTSTLALRRRR